MTKEIKRLSVYQESKATRDSWRDYERRNRRANLRYERESATVDRRYDPTGTSA